MNRTTYVGQHVASVALSATTVEHAAVLDGQIPGD